MASVISHATAGAALCIAFALGRRNRGRRGKCNFTAAATAIHSSQIDLLSPVGEFLFFLESDPVTPNYEKDKVTTGDFS